MSKRDYEYFVIGAGSGGVRSARIAASHGAKVGIAEGWDFGGTCVNRGCVPKKLLVYGSKFSKEFKDASGYGWKFLGFRWFKWRDLIRNKDKEINRLTGIYNSLLADSGVDVHKGYAKFIDDHTVEINGQQITADRILIATGGRPRVPNIPGKEHLKTSDDVFHLPSQPKNVTIIGGGYIAVEFACILQGLGSNVTLINRSDCILRGFDKDLQEHLLNEMKAKGIKFKLGCTPEKVTKRGRKTVIHTNQGETIESDEAIVAIGRDPMTDNLGLENTNVQIDKGGKIPTNKDNETSVAHIYAVGDIANDYNLTPVAIEEGHCLADRLFGNMPQRYISYDFIPTAVFSDPPIGTCGMTEEDLIAAGKEYKVYKTSFRPMKHTLSGRQERTFMKLLVCGESEKVLGVHMIGDDAPEIIQMAGIVLKMGGTKADFDATVGVHPTAAEEFVTMRTAEP